jgi:tetrapyrrole methylase family protein/MazG family protein
MELMAQNKKIISCDDFYESGDSFGQIYENIANFIMDEASGSASVCYCVPGHPTVAEKTVDIIIDKINKMKKTSIQPEAAQSEYEKLPDLQILTAASFLDSVFTLLKIDPVKEKLSILDAASLLENDGKGLPSIPKGACLFAQVYDRHIAGELKLALLDIVLPDTKTWILYHAGIQNEEKLVVCPLSELDHERDTAFDHLTSVFLPVRNDDKSRNADIYYNQESNSFQYGMDDLTDVFRRLTAPDGCPWDKQQTHESLKKYLLEEANEVLEAIDEEDMEHLKEELGDVLMQIVFHSVLAESRGDFNLGDVIDGITKKMIRRHPHVFGDEKAENPDEVMVLWQKIKEEEKR